MPRHIKAPALPAKILGFRSNLDATAKVDATKGSMTGIAVMTANLQPIGWPMWVDDKSVATLAAAFTAYGESKSYLTHDGAEWCDRQGEEIGLFNGYRVEGSVMRADFTALDAFRKHEEDDYDRLFELAIKAPATFGVSPVFGYTLAWVRQNGTEIPTELATYRYDSGTDDYLPVFEPSMPADSKTPLPCVRVVEVYSIDFTDRPATNPGLFSARPSVDGPANDKSPAVAPPPTMSLHTKLFAKFRSNPAQFARAVELHEGDTALSLESIVGTIEREDNSAQLATLRADLGTKDTELAALRESVKTKDGELVTLRAQVAKDAETIAAFRKGPAGGSEKVPTGPGGEPVPSAAKTMTQAAFSAMTAYQKMEFSSAGGRIVG